MSKAMNDSEPRGHVTRVMCTIIGCGVIGTSIADGLQAAGGDTQGTVPPTHQYRIRLVTRSEHHIADLQHRYPGSLITSCIRNMSLWGALPRHEVFGLHVVLICTQPQFTRDVCVDLRAIYASAKHLNTDDPAVKQSMVSSSSLLSSWPKTVLEIPTVFVTACPGIRVKTLASWLPQNAAIVRTMPNTPACIRQGATAAFAGPTVTAIPGAAEAVAALIRHVSPSLCFVPTEDLLDVAASVSGSAPAYIFTLMQAMVEAGVRRGLPPDIAASLVKQSAFGSAGLALQTGQLGCLEKLTSDVCVPGGSTSQAMMVLHEEGFVSAVDRAIGVSLAANRAMSNN
ncbi:pyrroline-5-carboxylate reductase [Pyricularia oryzae]|uniref:Pyrroline-5-carboxylate reductase n=2 Tax=Pyricularia oryzae TaxID=318829 RepID=A0AA97PGG6_PYRO3|nr:pyrroline-5-carboxylate reductase [Pyricularia oryzae Y34]KAI7910783.1 pyrroline-5-carboxylate reductase [Pyricularia oryzae]KAI7912765.1 pyrroline-5-carboxylate reductase [Pyricularia oryzae]